MKFTVLSTTSKHNKDFLQLPNRNILNKDSLNFLISSETKLKELLNRLDEQSIIIADCESKQSISLYNELIDSSFTVLDYKPNDLTMEAADIALLNYFNKKISSKSIAVYGTGNIAFKLALRLSERNVNVHLYGRNKKKLNINVEALKQITFDSSLIHLGDYESKVDALVSFVSADRVISERALKILRDKSLCLDGGIGNFSKELIQNAIESGHQVRRLDVRQSQEIMDGYINSRLNSEFDNIIGIDSINGHSVVAGGIMGEEGQVILDRITNPTKVIGIANGIGGVKDESELNDEEQSKVEEIQTFIEQDS